MSETCKPFKLQDGEAIIEVTCQMLEPHDGSRYAGVLFITWPR